CATRSTRFRSPCLLAPLLEPVRSREWTTPMLLRTQAQMQVPRGKTQPMRSPIETTVRERKRPMSRVRLILHPSDVSRASNAAFAKAVEMAKGNRAELLLAHVLAPIVPMSEDGYVPPAVRAARSEREDSCSEATRRAGRQDAVRGQNWRRS